MTVVAEALRGIANDIETHGHINHETGQDENGRDRTCWSPITHPEGPCCVILCPTYQALEASDRDAICRALSGYAGIGYVGSWSDLTPTDEVLTTIRECADHWEQNNEG